MPENNANNNPLNGPIPGSQSPTLSVATMLWNLAKNTFHLILKFYITIILVVYNWSVKVVEKALKPFQPIAAEVQKVPKKDVSVEGIFYQILRLQFLVLLYVAPFVKSVFLYAVSPLVWVRDWMISYVQEDGNDSWKRTDPTVLKEG